MDRLILELKLPPQDAYYKLTHTIQEVNRIISDSYDSTNLSTYQIKRISPELNNVIFASAEHGWSFSLLSYATMYSNRNKGHIDAAAMAKRLWGDWFYNEETKTFSKTKPYPASVRTFIQFVLDPIYKIYSQVSLLFDPF
jgi:U5 small nuclear ribonucleoprotein component